MAEKADILDFSLEELERAVEDLGQPAYRAKQIVKWLHKGVGHFDEMTDLPQAFRHTLHEQFRIGKLQILESLHSKSGYATKHLFLLSDHNIIECVVIRYKYGNTLCLSTQVGCRMGCQFCASTIGGLVRNLSAGEMLSHVIETNRLLEENGERRIGHLVLMGSGEPLDNYKNTIEFMKMVHLPAGINMSYRNITLSTCGLVPRMFELADEGLPVTLSVSLHAPNDNVRKLIMPVASAYSVVDIIKASRYYYEKTGRRITFEYTLIKDLNDREEHAEELAELIKGFPNHVNIIPLNEVEGLDFRRSPERSIQRFIQVLKSRGVEVTRRRELGFDIEGACGQLRRSFYSGSESQHYER